MFLRVPKVKGESTKFLIINFKITSYGAKALLRLVQLAIKSICRQCLGKTKSGEAGVTLSVLRRKLCQEELITSSMSFKNY